MEKIKALLVKPNELPLEIELHNTLKTKEKLVGGLIEVACLNNTKDDICLISNENAKIENLPINRFLGNQFIYGDFLVFGDAYETGDFKYLEKEIFYNTTTTWGGFGWNSYYKLQNYNK